jgi:ferredoxin
VKVEIDLALCTGHGVCEGIRPDIFEVIDGGSVRLLTDDFTEVDRQDLDDAVYQCPTQAIRLDG